MSLNECTEDVHMMLQPEANMSLVDYLAKVLNCEYVGELHYLDRHNHKRLVSVLRKIPTTHFSCWDWNDALEYLTKKLGRNSAEEAKMLLLATLETT